MIFQRALNQTLINQNENQVIQGTVGDFPAISIKTRFFKAKLILFYDQFFLKTIRGTTETQG